MGNECIMQTNVIERIPSGENVVVRESYRRDISDRRRLVLVPETGR